MINRKSRVRKSPTKRKNSKSHSRVRKSPSKRKSKSRSRVRKSPYAGWAKVSPKRGVERNVMLEKCGKKCFLGSDKSFPICNRGTCKVNKKGVHAAYVRAKQNESKYPSHRIVAKRAFKKLQ